MRKHKQNFMLVPSGEITQEMLDWCQGTPIYSRTAPAEAYLKAIGPFPDSMSGYPCRTHEQALAEIKTIHFTIQEVFLLEVPITDGVIASNGLDLSAVSINDWTDYSIDITKHEVVITEGTGDVVDGSYDIVTVASDKLTLASSVGGSGTCTLIVGIQGAI